MKILNVRLGFATNSSSSHSILLLRDHGLADGGMSGDGYGWEHFVLSSVAAKRHYLASQVAQNLGYNTWDNDPENAIVVERLRDAGLDLDAVPGYVDHQSTWAFPRDWLVPERLDAEYLGALAEFLARDDVVVLGGNDNEWDHSHHLLENDRYRGAIWHDTIPSEQSGLTMVARRDAAGFWTLFNRLNGNKVRLSFNADDPTPIAASAPELVDVKITDYCPFGCPFCYQDSTLEGKHATLENLVDVANKIAAAKVFEVAIGGGEPTLHPDFITILRIFRNRGVVPNFTTRNLGWLNKPDAETILDLCGSFAFSAQTADEVRHLNEILADGIEPTIHIVMGTVDRETLAEMLDVISAADFDVTLLGWKRTGRAQDPEHPYLDWWWETAHEHAPHRLGIDTALAAESEAAGLLADVPKWQYHTADGPWSCYIDAVNMTVAPSSWQPERGSHALTDGWLDVFRTFAETT